MDIMKILWEEESEKKSKHIIRSNTEENTVLAKTYRLDDVWFIVTKKQLDGKSSKFLIAYEKSTGHFVTLASSMDKLVDRLVFLLPRVKEILRKEKIKNE